MNELRGRFAPTPSGRMHLGNAYAMLAAWLSAHGHVLLRLEDLDTPRVKPDADKWIMDDLAWLGLTFSGKPTYQSERGELYHEALELLRAHTLGDARDAMQAAGMIDAATTCNASTAVTNAATTNSPSAALFAENAALTAVNNDATSNAPSNTPSAPLTYPCFCSRADLHAASAPQAGDGFSVYAGTCRALNAKQQRAKAQHKRPALRLRVADTLEAHFCDRVFGEQRFALGREVGDAIIQRADGVIGYQLAVVVDDLLMGINDVVRGRDLLRSTALQIWLRSCLVALGFHGFNAASANRLIPSSLAHPDHRSTELTPRYTHLPLLDNAAHRRLAKRDHSLDLGELRARGMSAERMIGICAQLLGIHPSGEPLTTHDALALYQPSLIARNLTDRVVSPALA